MAGNSVATVAGLYRDVLGRLPDDGALAALVPALDNDTITPDPARIGLATSPEARDLISAAYIGILGRTADAPGLAQAVNTLAYGGQGIAAIRAGLGGSAEAQAAVSRYYVDILGRTADAAGLMQWVNGLAAGTQTLASIRAGISGSVEAAQTVAVTYSQTLGRDVDGGGLASALRALQNGNSLNDLRAGLGTSREAAGSLTRAYQYQFGTSPTTATLTVLQGELARGKTFLDTARVDQRVFNRAILDYGYTVEPQYSATGQAQFVQVYVPIGIFNVLLPQTRQVPYDQSANTANPDRIVVDLYGVSADGAVGVTFSLDGRYLGRASVQAPAPTMPSQTAVDEITLIGGFGPSLHDLQITVDDPARGSVVAAGATFNRNNFLLGTASTGVGGTLDLFPHPGPQPPVSFVFKYPGL